MLLTLGITSSKLEFCSRLIATVARFSNKNRNFGSFLFYRNIDSLCSSKLLTLGITSSKLEFCSRLIATVARFSNKNRNFSSSLSLKLLSLGNIQINLILLSLNRNFGSLILLYLNRRISNF
jgi:hypothetical protein